MSSTRAYLFHVLHNPSRKDGVGRNVSYFLTCVILANCAAVALETVPSIYQPRQSFFYWLEAFSTGIFVVEYLARIWVAVEEPRFSSPVLGRLKYALHPLAVLDLIVIVTYFAPGDFRFLRIFRLSKLLRVLNLEEFDRSLQAVSRANGRRTNGRVVSFLAMLTIAYCFAALLYIVEHSVQPERFSSIPETIWWAIVTLTTIGYGDVIPITTLGKLLSGGIVLVGIGVFALPSAIVTASILEAGADKRIHCPHCGNKLE